MFIKLTVATVLAALLGAKALTIAEIQGTGFNSPYVGQAVTDVSGVVTAIGPAGIWIRSTKPDNDDRTSESVYVFTGTSKTSIRNLVVVGQTITIDGKVEEYRSSKDYLYLTEITGPKNLRASNGTLQTVKPIVLDRKNQPPTQLYTSLDTNGDIFAIPNNASLIETSGIKLEPSKYGLDFWESLEGELVTIKKPISLGFPNTYGDFWVRGSDWKVTGENDRGGLTLIPGKGQAGADANPEAIVIGEPIDGTTKNDGNIRLGDSIEDITGVVSYAFGFYRILPLTGAKISRAVTPATPNPTTLKSDKKCSLTFGAYNVENLSPSSAHLGSVASHIVDYLRTPDLVFLQEVQDNNGATNNGIVDASETLKTLADAIFALSGTQYSFTDIAPTDGKDGGAPGGNIRTAYFYNPQTIALKNANPGTATDPVAIKPNGDLNFNPGRIDPLNTAWTASRKPLVALFQAKNGKKPKNIYTINVHFGSKGGSSSSQGDARPPVNGGVADRLAQATAVRSFVQTILNQDKDAQLIASGDFNEFAFVEPMKLLTDKKDGVFYDLDEVANIKDEERYTYLFDGNSQQLDHTLISKALRSKAKYQHIHVNTWAKRLEQVSDHDPSVALLEVC